MKKILFLILCLLFLSANAQALKGSVEESYVPAGFYGTWSVVSKLKNCTNPDMFNFESRDIWTLSGHGEVLILENLETGARSEIIVKERNKDGKTLKFVRQKTVNGGLNKIIYKEIITFVLNGNNFSGYDNFIVEKYAKNGDLIAKNSANYQIEGAVLAK